jgi:hypothetical protein
VQNTTAQSLTDPSLVDPGNGTMLKEAGLSDASLATYKRDADTLTIHALRFNDASGAYSAYTFYRQPNWPRQLIGTGAASDNNRVLFWLGNIVVDATFSHVTVMSVAEMRSLASQLPMEHGSGSVPPPILGYLPQQGQQPMSTRYALGQDTYKRSGGVLPASLLKFDLGAESLSATYRIQGNQGLLTLVEYPTPQLAAEREKAITEFLKPTNQQQWTQALRDSNPAALLVRRTGPVLAITSGALFDRQAKELAGSVNYQAEVTWSKATQGPGEIKKTAQLLIGIVLLVAILFGAALVFGIFFGGARVLWLRIRGEKEDPTANSFISLHLPTAGSEAEKSSANSDQAVGS